jgi:phosphatidylinositol alpha 1,6-mannosyltransferase
MRRVYENDTGTSMAAGRAMLQIQWRLTAHRVIRATMHATDLRIALFSGNYNYVRDGANQALNLLVGHLLSKGVTVRVYSPTNAKPAFPPTGDLVAVPSLPLPAGRGEYKMARGLPAAIRRDLDAFAPNIVHVSAPDFLGHRAISYGRRNGIATVASLHTRFETYFRYYKMAFFEPIMVKILTRFYNRVDEVLVPGRGMAEIVRDWGVMTPTAIWSRCLHYRCRRGVANTRWRVGFLRRSGAILMRLHRTSSMCRRPISSGTARSAMADATASPRSRRCTRGSRRISAITRWRSSSRSW